MSICPSGFTAIINYNVHLSHSNVDLCNLSKHYTVAYGNNITVNHHKKTQKTSFFLAIESLQHP